MHFTRIRDVGTWTVSVLTPTEIEAFDAHQFAAINGDEGGEWSPSSAIIIGGAGVQITGTFTASGNVAIGTSATQVLTVYAEAYFVSAVQFDGNALFMNPVVFQGNVTIGLSATQVLTIKSEAYFVSAAQFDDAVLFEAPVTLANDLALNGEIVTPVDFGTGGYLKRRFIRITSGAQADVSLANYDHIVMAAAIPCYLADYGENGAVMHVSNTSGGSLDVKNAGGTTIKTLATKTWAEIMRNSGLGDGWEVVKYGSGL